MSETVDARNKSRLKQSPLDMSAILDNSFGNFILDTQKANLISLILVKIAISGFKIRSFYA